MDKHAGILLSAAMLSAVVACGTITPGGPAGGGTGSGSAGGSAGSGSASPAQTASVGGPVPSAAPTNGSPADTPAALTVSDDAATVRLSTGQAVTVILAPSSPLSWHVPVATGAAVRRTAATGGYPSREPARATFLAVHPGRAYLSAMDDAPCLHAQQRCMLPQRSWRVLVIVAPA